jgi:uncharacterized spore protein YtfJ
VTLDPKKFNTQLNAAVRSIPQDSLTEALGPDGLQNLYKINQGLSKTLVNESRTAALNRAIQASVQGAPKGSPISTLAYTLLTPVAGATVGAGVGATKAAMNGQDARSGAAEGALVGGAAGGVASVPVGVIHFMYTHPAWGAKMLELSAKGAPLASQAVKQVTHVFNADTGKLEKANDQE